MDSGVRFDEVPAPPPGGAKKRMAKPALKLAEKNHTEKIKLARDMAGALTANAALVPTPKVTPAQLTAGAQGKALTQCASRAALWVQAPPASPRSGREKGPRSPPCAEPGLGPL